MPETVTRRFEASRDPAKREALLDAARALFLKYGLDAVIMDQIVAEAGVSRATLYSYFTDKAALLEAMIGRESERIVSDAWVQESLGGDLETALTDFGVKLLAFLSNPQMIAMERLIAAAAQSFPEVAQRFFAAGPGRAKAILARIIGASQAQGLIAPADVAVAVHDLVGLWQGFLRVEMTFRQRAAPSDEELRRQAAHGVRQFLRLYGRRALFPAADA